MKQVRKHKKGKLFIWNVIPIQAYEDVKNTAEVEWIEGTMNCNRLHSK